MRRLFLVLLFPLVSALALLMTYGGFFDAGYMPPCMINQWTGWHCPGCGGTRALQSLARADLFGALRMNPLGVFFILGVALLILRASWEAAFPALRWPRFAISHRLLWAVVSVMVAFVILRNLPWWPFLLLAPH